MVNKVAFSKLRLFLVVIFLFLVVVVISTSCICPLISLVERLTGMEIKTGKNIDQSLILSELIYPDSTVLLQTEGDIDKIVELASKYGAVLTEKDLSILDELPQEIREKEIGATIYSTADDKMRVLEYYDSMVSKGWAIQGFQSEGGTEGEGRVTMFLASREEDVQTFMLVGTQNNTFIIFIDFDWGVLTEVEK
jgi:hypothetical protein